MGKTPEQEKAGLTRREFMSKASLFAGWGGVAASAGGGGLGVLRYMVPNILYEPSAIFKIGKPADYGIGVDTHLMKERQIWVVRNLEGIYVMIGICRHLGCTPNWFSDQQRFRCPCHGSIYDTEGNVRGGPAPRTLWRAGVMLDPVDEQIVVNFNQRQDPDPKGTDEGLIVERSLREVPPFFLKI